jgi:uncharacterized membrane protein
MSPAQIVEGMGTPVKMTIVIIVLALWEEQSMQHQDVQSTTVDLGQSSTAGRLPFIDFARGVVMALMAWDHVSSFWNPGRRANEGLMGMRAAFPNFTQFLLRFVTHWAAPTFVFLAGTALALSTARRQARGESERDITLRLVKRGGMLLLLEAFVVAPAFGLPPLYFGVLASIGVCFILFSVARHLPPAVILALSLIIVVGHPLFSLDWIPDGPASPWGHYLRVILLEPRFDLFPYVGLYPVIPWIGVMGLGWSFGIFLTGYDVTRVRRLALPLVLGGAALIGLCLGVRLLNGYGNLLPRPGGTLEDWLYMSKYPPSLTFLLWTLGGTSLFMALGVFLQERPGFERGLTGVLLDFGRVPLFFYLAHLWLYRVNLRFAEMGFTLDLLPVGIFWLLGLLILWRLGLRYEKFKRSYPDSLLQYI